MFIIVLSRQTNKSLHSTGIVDANEAVQVNLHKSRLSRIIKNDPDVPLIWSESNGDSGNEASNLFSNCKSLINTPLHVNLLPMFYKLQDSDNFPAIKTKMVRDEEPASLQSCKRSLIRFN